MKKILVILGIILLSSCQFAGVFGFSMSRASKERAKKEQLKKDNAEKQKQEFEQSLSKSKKEKSLEIE